MSNITADEPTAEKPLNIVIKDASTKDHLVNFTIEMKTNLPQYATKEVVVSRSHSDFEWLHRLFVENEKYAGIIIPPCPPKPDFNVNRDSISVYTEDENVDTEDYKKMRQELEREYLALFKKAVASHDLFLTRIAKISILRTDPFFVEFITSQDSINSKSDAVTFFKDIFKVVKKSIDSNILNLFSTIKDPDTYFEEENRHLNTYCPLIKSCIDAADDITLSQKRIANCMIKLGLELGNFSKKEQTKLSRILEPISAFIDRVRKIECRIATDEDLKLSDTFRFHYYNSEACKDLLLRRIQSLIASENSLKALQKAKQLDKNVTMADDQYQQNFKRYESINESAKTEIKRENIERVGDFKRNLTSYCELQITNYRNILRDTQMIIDRIEAEDII